MKRLSLILIVCLCVNAQAQVAGYMGKRVYISYSNLYSISTLFYPLNETGPSHSLGLNFVTGKRGEFSISANYFSSKIQNNLVDYSNRSNQYSDQGIYTFDGVYASEKMNSFGASIALKVFRRDRFAPIGPYAKWEIIFYEDQLKIKPYKISYFNYYTNTTTTMEYGGIRKIISAGGGFGFGKQKVLKDKIIVDVGVRGAIVYSAELEYGYTYYEQDVISGVFGKVLTHEILNLRLGIGFLAF